MNVSHENLPDQSETTPSLQKTQSLLKKRGVFAVLVRSTDRYFNEYVPRHLSIRTQITGFDGSVGDAIITESSAHLFVDGRYSLQAQSQASGFTIHVCQNAQSIENKWLSLIKNICGPRKSLLYDPSTIDLNLFEKLSAEAKKLSLTLDPGGESFFHDLLGQKIEDSSGLTALESIDKAITGQTLSEKLQKVAAILKENQIFGLLVTKLDDIAWLTNLRSYYFPYQSSLPGLAVVFPDKIVVGISITPKNIKLIAQNNLEFVQEDALFLAIKSSIVSGQSLGIDPKETSKAHELALRNLDIPFKHLANPISELKAIKNEKELLHLRSAFKKADHAIYKTQNYLVDCFEKEMLLNECDVDHHIKQSFKETGAKELSFRPICASGENGAIIHYGHPNREKMLTPGALFLLDTGAYYEGGYATDLTRTFLLGKRSEKAQTFQKSMFTYVLKASIRGLSARIKRGTTGMQLDAMVRYPLWQVGLDFAHGTGHGVGINVHEFPPRIAPTSSTELKEGQVFSIEPGLYFAGLGGVRIENLATLVADPDHEQFLRVLPLTFCPLDDRLINEQMLDHTEKAFLEYFKQEWQNNAPWPNLPPLEPARIR